MGVDNRLTAEQLAALEPGDTVTIESGQDFRRPRQATGTVVRVAGPDIVVKVASRHGVAHQELYRRRDGIRIGGVSRAELVNTDTTEPAGTPLQRRQVSRVDAAYRAWARNRADLDKLRGLQEAIAHVVEQGLIDQP